MRAAFGRHPVVFLTFKDVKTQAWTDCRAAIIKLVADACRRHEPTLAASIKDSERADWQALRDGTADNATLWRALALLSERLHRATGERAVILVDEYDTPIHAGDHHGYYEDVVELFRNLFSGGFNDNPHLEKGVLTGILRVAKESIFSGLNNLAVHGLLSRSFSSHFGFTADEVAALAEACGASDRLADIERWYDGYRFGDQAIYNPWSVLSYLANPDNGLRPYWVQTASDDILRELLVERGQLAHQDLAELLRGGTVVRAIDEHIVPRDVRQRTDAVWSFLLFSGYLKAVSAEPAGRHMRVELGVPNLEVRAALEGMCEDFLGRGLGDRDRVGQLCRALLDGDGAGFEELLEALLLASLSHHDLAVRQPEAVYQAFILGLLVTLESSHEVTSNREAGHGRYDVLVGPRKPGDPGVVLELKVLDVRRGETVEQALDSALAQVRARDYAAVLRERGAAPVRQMAAVVDGKRAWVRVAA